jgi:L-amino acid N-acyltransferase YncA
MAITIRLATLDDAEQIQAIYAPFCRDTPVSFETQPPTVDEMRQRIVKTLSSLPWFVCDDGRQIVGYAYASQHRERAAYRWSVDVSVYVREGQRRSGFGRALYTSLLNSLRLQGFYNALAGVSVPNPASVGLHEAMGFQPLGVYQGIGFKNGSWHDVLWLQLQLRERASQPDEPRVFPIVQDSEEWREALTSGLAALRPTGGRLMSEQAIARSD